MLFRKWVYLGIICCFVVSSFLFLHAGGIKGWFKKNPHSRIQNEYPEYFEQYKKLADSQDELEKKIRELKKKYRQSSADERNTVLSEAELMISALYTDKLEMLELKVKMAEKDRKIFEENREIFLNSEKERFIPGKTVTPQPEKKEKKSIDKEREVFGEPGSYR